jgi:hypothetical protein
MKVLTDRNSAELAKALSEIFMRIPVSKLIWTDTGKEFEGALQVHLKERTICHIYSTHRNSSQTENLKVSRA